MKFLLPILLLAALIPFSQSQTPTTGDAFGVGSVWVGKRKFEKENGNLKKRALGWSLRITERNGGEFKGIITVETNVGGDNFQCEVTGEAPAQGDGDVRFKSEAKGDFRQTFYGKIKGGGIALDFKGRAATGESVEGTAGLSRK